MLERGVAQIRAHEAALTGRLIAGLRGIPGVRVVGTQDARRQTAAVSFTRAGRSCSAVAHTLDEEYGVLCRPGLHCAPQAHRTLGTFPDGTVRLSAGPRTTPAEIAQAISAVAQVARVE